MCVLFLERLAQGVLKLELKKAGAAIFAVRARRTNGEVASGSWPIIASATDSETDIGAFDARASKAMIADSTASRWPLIGRTKTSALEKATTPN